MKALHFLQYHNATIIILIGIVLVLGTYVFAQTDTGQEIIGQPEEKVISIDNKALLEADLEDLDMEFRILNIEQSVGAGLVPAQGQPRGLPLQNATSTPTPSLYYITYSYKDLVLEDNVWQWKDKQKTAEISEKAFEGRDLGDYLAEEFSEIAFWRQKELKEKQDKAKQIGPTEKIVVTEYSGLIGKVLDLKNAIFSGYEPVVVEIAQIVPVESVQETSIQDTNNNQIPITNDQNEIPQPESVGAQFIAPEIPESEPESVGAGLVPAQGQPQGLPLQESPIVPPIAPPIEPPIIENATTTQE